MEDVLVKGRWLYPPDGYCRFACRKYLDSNQALLVEVASCVRDILIHPHLKDNT